MGTAKPSKKKIRNSNLHISLDENLNRVVQVYQVESLLGTEPAEKPTFELPRDASFNLSSIEFFSGPGSGK